MSELQPSNTTSCPGNLTNEQKCELMDSDLSCKSYDKGTSREIIVGQVSCPKGTEIEIHSELEKEGNRYPVLFFEVRRHFYYEESNDSWRELHIKYVPVVFFGDEGVHAFDYNDEKTPNFTITPN